MSSHHARRLVSAISLLAFVAASALSTAAHACPAHEGSTAHLSKRPRSIAAVQAEPSLAEVRKATERFRDVNVALAEGYVRDPANLCDTAEMMGQPAALGAMGIHFFRPDLLGITAPPNPRVDGIGTAVRGKRSSRKTE